MGKLRIEEITTTQVSDAQLEANRRNAQHSTGPRTTEGKNRSRMNTIAHGFTAQGVVLTEDDAPHYKANLQTFMNEHRPKGPTELFLVETLAETAWTVSKIRAQEQNFMTIVGQTGHNPFEGPDPETNVLLTQANHSRNNAKQIELLSRYEQRKMRLFRETLRDLKLLQQERKLAEQQQSASEQTAQTAQAAPQAQPSQEIGFVCPDPQTQHAQAIEDRLEPPPTTL
jgi:hypothetical protein